MLFSTMALVAASLPSMMEQVAQLTFQPILAEEDAIAAANRTQRHLQSVSDGGQNVFLFNSAFFVPEQGFKFAYGSGSAQEADLGKSSVPFIHDAFLTYGEAAEGSASFGSSDSLHLLTPESADWDSSWQHGISNLIPSVGTRYDNNQAIIIAHRSNSGLSGPFRSPPLSYADMTIGHAANHVAADKCALLVVHMDRRLTTSTQLCTYVKVGDGTIFPAPDMFTGQVAPGNDQECDGEWEIITLPMNRKLNLNTAGRSCTTRTCRALRRRAETTEWNRGKSHSVHPILTLKIAAGKSPALVLHGDSRGGLYPVTMTCLGCSYASTSDDSTVALVSGAMAAVGFLVGLYLCCRFVPGGVLQSRVRPESDQSRTHSLTH